MNFSWNLTLSKLNIAWVRRGKCSWCVICYQYHPTSELMQILHFDWLHYQGNISNSHQVAKFGGFSFFFSHINISSTCICQLYYCLFCPTTWVILKQLDPSPSRTTGLIVILSCMYDPHVHYTPLLLPNQHAYLWYVNMWEVVMED